MYLFINFVIVKIKINGQESYTLYSKQRREKKKILIYTFICSYISLGNGMIIFDIIMILDLIKNLYMQDNCYINMV